MAKRARAGSTGAPTERLTVILDDRVGSKELAVPLQRIGVGSEITRLEYGDIAFHGNGPSGPVTIGVERKRVRDMVNSIREKRISVQAAGMMEVYDVRYLIIEGPMGTGESGELRWMERGKMGTAFVGTKAVYAAEVYGYIQTLREFAGFRIAQTEGMMGTVYLLRTLLRWWGKEWDDHTALGIGGVGAVVIERGGVKLTTARPNLVWRMAAGMNGIGPKGCREIAKAFKTPREMVMADEKDWRRVKGVGKGMAKKIVNGMETGEDWR